MSEQPATAESSWSKEQIEKLLSEETFRYQAIPLPYGIKTDGHDRTPTADRIFPKTMPNESVMDVGCGLGFFCFNAKGRGAGRVLGVDLETENIRKGRILADILGQDVEFTFRDLEKDPIDEAFDHVLCLNVMHHLVDPIHSLDRLISCAKKRLILEVATIGKHDRRMLKMNRLEQALLERLPVMVIGTGGVTAGIKQFYFTKTAVENLLRYRRGCFASVEIFPSEFKGRFIVVGHMHQINQEVVLAGPMESISKELNSLFNRGQVESLDTQLGVDSTTFKTTLAANDYHLNMAPQTNHLAFEYDFMRPFNTGSMTFSHDPSTEVMEVAQETTVLTGWISPDSLLQKLEDAHAKSEGRAKKSLSRTVEECRSPQRVVGHYRKWMEYARRFKAHTIVDLSDGSNTLMTPDEWESQVATPIMRG